MGCWEGLQGVAGSRRRPEVAAAYQDSGQVHSWREEGMPETDRGDDGRVEVLERRRNSQTASS